MDRLGAKWLQCLLEIQMSTVGVKELKNRLTEYLRLAKNGEEIIVTDRGRPIALIQAIHGTQGPTSIEARLAKAASQGHLVLPSGRRSKKTRLIRIGGKPLSKIIIEERE